MASFESTISWCLLILFSSLAHGAIYRYPVALFSDNNRVLILTDHNQNLELSLYAHSSETEEKILSARYMPAGVQLLHDETGFSFVDDGILCIKRFDRRSVHMIEPAEPLYDIEYVHWLDNEWCYFHAKRAGHNGIYLMDRDGSVIALLEGNDTIDYLYPHIREGILFCIMGKKNVAAEIQYSIGSAFYKDCIKDHENALQCIMTIGTQPLALVHMLTASEGFFLAYPSTRDSGDQLFQFTCYHFFAADGAWKSEALFSFFIPSALLFDADARLYESILPLKPLYDSRIIYYCSCELEKNNLSLYSYSMTAKKIALVKQEANSLFAPYFMKNVLIYGSELTTEEGNGIKMLQIDERN